MIDNTVSTCKVALREDIKCTLESLVWFNITQHRRTDRQTDRYTHRNTSRTSWDGQNVAGLRVNAGLSRLVSYLLKSA